MAITCALGPKHIKALTKVISKAMLTSLEKGEAFDINAFMNKLYTNLKERQGLDNAMQYMQQVPYIANRIDAKLEIELSKDNNGNEINLKSLSRLFRNEDTGVQTVMNYFEQTVTPKELSVIAIDNANRPVEKYENVEEKEELPIDTYDDERLKARNIFSATHEEFFAKTPGTISEEVDKTKLHIINAIGRISLLSRNIDALDSIQLDGVDLKLKAIPITRLSSDQLTEYTSRIIATQRAIENQGTGTGKVTPISEQFALVITDRKGKFVYFAQDGTVTTQEKGGKIVYQMLRDVRKFGDKYMATDIYGIENQIITPQDEAKRQLKESGLTKADFEDAAGMSYSDYVVEVGRQQQEKLKQVYDFKNTLVKENKTAVINLAGASRGVLNNKVSKNVNLRNISILFPEIKNDIIKSITNLETNFSGFKSGRTIVQVKGEYFELDRSQIDDVLAQKIADVLTNPKLKKEERFSFYTQFFTKNGRSEKIDLPSGSQRHDLYFDGTDLVFAYVPNTAAQARVSKLFQDQNKEPKTIDLNDPKAAEEIKKILRSGWSYSGGEVAGSNISYNTALIKGDQKFFDYENDKLVESKTSYIDFLFTQNGKLKISPEKAVPLFNSYLTYNLDNVEVARITKAKEAVEDKVQEDSEMRKFKDALVAEIKANPEAKLSAEVVKVKETSVSDTLNKKSYSTYTITVKIDGKEGEHMFYQSENNAAKGDVLSIELNPIVIKDGFGYPNNISLTKVESGKIKYFGDLAETDFKAKEPQRLPVPLQQDYVAEQMEEEALDEAQVAPKTVTEEESEIQQVQGLNPSDTENPADKSNISDLFSRFKLDRKTSLPTGVTGEQVENAINWWNNSPLNKYIALEQVANIVNSDAYARFLIAGSTMLAGQYTGKLGAIQINKATGGSLVDTYHEAWHGFSQLFLTRQEKIDLYNELKKSNPKYKEYSFLELEEILAEDFRSYALNQNTKPKSPKRNTLFRRILNFLQKLFGGDTSTADNIQPYNVESQGVAGELFRNLYLASSNPDLLNIYTPSIDNVMFDMLNRGIMQVGSKNEPALSPRDSEIVNDSVDSLLSEVVDDSFDLRRQADPLTANKSGTTKIITDLENREVAYEIVKEKFKEKLKTLRDKLKTTPEKPFASFNTLKNLEDNASAIIRSSKGDDKYVFLKSQIDDYNNLSLATKAGQRVKGEIYKNTIEVIGDFYTHNSIKDTTKDNATILVVDTIEEAKAQFDSYREGGAESFDKFQINPLVNAKSTYEITSNQSRILDSIRILQTAVRNWDSVIKYNQSNSDYEIVKKEYSIEKTNEEEDATEDVTKSEKVKSEVGKETLFELAGKDVVYILRSLHKKIKFGDTYVDELNELGFKKRADFRKVWATLVKATQGTKDPKEMYRKIVEASANFEELKQLIEYKLPVVDKSNTSYEFDIITSFWSVFSLPKVQYKQLSLFRAEKGLTTEVTSGSLDVKNVVRSFQSNFQSDKNNAYAIVSKGNVSYLNLDAVVNTFSKAGEFDDSKAIDFLKAIGINLEDTSKLKDEILNLKNRTYYGLPYIFDTIKELNILDKKAVKTKENNELLAEFKLNPILVLSKGIPEKTIGEKGTKYYNEGSKQKTQIERIAELQMTLGFGINSMSASNAEGNKVNEVTTDNTLTFLADALNTVDSRTNMYKEGNPLRFLNPKNNPWASSSITLKNLFSASDARDVKRNIIVDLVSGTQRTDAEITDGQNTTNLSQQGKLIQDVHTLLKSGIVETMRPGSKSAAWSWRIEGGIQVGIGKRNESYLYADIDSFITQSGKERGVIESLILPYLDSELKRINIYKTNPKAKNYIGYNAKANQQGEAFGEIFNVFNGVLTNKTQNELKELITDPNVSLLDYLEETTDLKNKIIREVYSYFTNKTNELYNQYNEASYFDPKLMNKLSQIDVSETEKQKILLKAFFYNNWIHNVETSILFFTGDIAQLDHSKENGHKRTSGLISNGPRLRTDIAAQKYISNVDEGGFNNSTYARTLGEKYDKFRYDGYVNTAVIQDIARDSIYAPEMRTRFEKDLKAKYPKMSDSEAKRLVEKKVSKYLEGEIKEGDGQGYITIDAYRAFKKLQNKWSNDQERLYQKVIKGEEISLDDLKEGFPVYKLQNFGFAEDTVLPVGIMHKFALFPLIPSAIKGTELEALHKKMLEDNIQYVTFVSGSKIGGVTSDGKPDQIFEAGSKKIKADAKFTNNRIHAGFIKEVTSVPSKLKGEVIFSTQLRKLILEGLYEHGSYTSEKAKQLADNYKNIVDFYTAVLTKELETEIGYRKDEKGIYIGKPDKFLKLIQRNLEQKDYPNHIIDSLKLNPDGTLKSDLSYFIDTEGIENIVMSIINKKLVKQKVNGEALVQVASSMWNGSWDAYQGNKFKNLKGKELEEATRKYLGTNNLPFYTEGADGNTSAMKVAIALQGDFFNLLNLLHNDGEKIGTIKRLNEMIKDEDWLNKDNNRKSITMTAVRIPVQGLNSMEFMEVYEFLDPTAQNVIILPTEIVGKSGGDYDVDKLTTFFPNINKDGSYALSSVSNNKFTEEITNIESAGKNPKEFIKNQKRAVQNQMIQGIRSILEIPENYTSLLTPNDTDILKPLADDLQKYVSPRDKYAKANGEVSNISAKGRQMISPTSMFEPLYNNEKFGANMGGKGVLGIFANDNALHPLLTSVGYKMPMKYKAPKWNDSLKRWVEKGKAVYDMRLFLPHNVVDGHISLSNINTINGTKIADLYSQGVNGSVDVEADEWVFYIQGNLEVASNLSYLIKAGVPEDTAVYFVSNPLVREYAQRQRLAKGVFGEATETGSVISQMTQYDSANYVFRKYIPQFIKNKLEGISPNEKLTVIINEPSLVNKFGDDKKYEYTASEFSNNLQSILSNKSLTIKSITVMYNNAPAYLLYNHFNPSTKKIYETASFLSGMPGVLKNDQFNTDELYKLITNTGELSQEQLDLALAGFAHFLEIEKQTKGFAELKRQIKPDVNALRSMQEVVIKNLNIDLVFDNSKIDNETANRAINESVVSTFGNTEIIEKIFMPLMPLVNGNGVSRFIADSVGGYGENSKNKIDIINKFYGSGQDGIIRFINSFKPGLKTFIFQNYLSNFIDANGSLTTLPNEYYKQNVKINNNLDTDVAIINGEFIVNEKKITQDFEQKRYLSDNTQPGNYSSREGLVPFDLENDVFNTKELYFKYVLERERLFFLGLRGDELNQMALVNAFNPNVLLGNNKYSYTDLLLSTIDKNRRALSKNYDIIDQIRKAVELKNVNVLTLSNKKTLTGSEQSRYATELKALGNPRIQKVEDPEENTRISRLFRLLPQISIYQHGVGKTFYGFDFALPQDDYEKTMTAAGDLFKNNYNNVKTFDLVFKKLTESKARVKNLVVSPEEYNSYVPLKAEYVEPLDLDEDQVFEAQKPVFTTPTPTTQSTEVKEGVSELFESKPELANIGTPEQYSEWINYLTTQGKLAGTNATEILYHGADQEFETFDKTKRGSATGESYFKDEEQTPIDSLNAFFFSTEHAVAEQYGLLRRVEQVRRISGILNRIRTHMSMTKPVNVKEFVKMLEEVSPELVNHLREKQQELSKEDFKDYINNISKKYYDVNQELGVEFLNEYNSYIRLGKQLKDIESKKKDILSGNYVHNTFSKQYPNLSIYLYDKPYDSTKINEKGEISSGKYDGKNITELTETELDDLLNIGNASYKKGIDAINSKLKKAKITPILYRVLLNVQRPLAKDFENKTFVDQVYEAGAQYEASKLTNQAAKSKGEYDSVIFKNILDPYLSDNYGVFEPEQVYILGNKEDQEGFKEFVSNKPTTQPSTQPTTAPVNYNEVPKVQVQPKLEPGRYVTFDNKTWIVTKQNENGTWQIYNPLLEGAQAKKSVAEKNLGIRPEIAKIVNYRDQAYLVTPNETIISLVTNKKMKWNSNDGNRIGILQLANNTISPTQPTVPVSETADDYTFTFADGTPIPIPFKLNEQQQQALLGLEKFYNNPSEYNNEIALIGYAGTGKTTIMSLFDKYLMSKGEMPRYSAPTHRANAVTKLNNPTADVITLHKAFGLNPVVDLTNGQLSVENLQSEQTGKPLVAHGDYLIIDESSMITDQLYEFIEKFKKEFKIKVIYMGDPAQLAPVDPRKKETALSVALEKPTKLQLTKVERTSDNPILTESTNLREGKPLSGISDEVNGRGVEYISDSARTNQVIGQSLQEMQETDDFLHFRMLSAKNNGIKTLNDLARKNLYNVDDSTQLVDGEILMGYDNFGGNMDSYDIYNSGDYRVIGISGETKKIIDTDTASGKLEFTGYDIVLEDLLQKDSGPVFVFIAKKGSVNEGSSKKLIAALSELARKGKNANDKRTRGMYFSMMYALRKEVAFMEDQYNDFGKVAIKKTVDYGYAHTIHKSQGGTYNKVLILLDTIDNSKFDSIVKQQLRYVAVSRARDYVYLIKNSGPLSQTTEDVTEVERTSDDNVISSITLEQLTNKKPTVASKATAELPMDDSNITKIINGTKVITNRTALFSDGVYTIGGIQQVQLKYLGKGVVVGNNIVITDENTKQSYVRSKDDFAKGEGFKNWSDFQLNNKFSQKFISGESARYIYSVKPIGEIKEEFGAAQKLNPENNPVIAAFNQKLVENKGTLPKELIYDSGSFISKYVLNPNNLYNLVDVETGTIYLRNINLQTGDIVSIDEPLVPVSDKRVAEIISGLKSQIKAYRLDEILAEKGIDINEEIDKLENVNFESELNEIMVRINKNMC